ncbi:MAG: pseudouridylate synthase [Bacteroidaceae bacterium]
MISGRMATEFERIDILELLPQRRPFVMVDRLVHYDPVVTTTRFKVRPDNLFCDDGHLSASGMVENIAQTCAARLGYINYTSGQPVKIGYIGSVNNFMINRNPAAGETLMTTIEVIQEVFNITLVHARIMNGTETLAEADLKIALADEVAKTE